MTSESPRWRWWQGAIAILALAFFVLSFDCGAYLLLVNWAPR